MSLYGLDGDGQGDGFGDMEMGDGDGSGSDGMGNPYRTSAAYGYPSEQGYGYGDPIEDESSTQCYCYHMDGIPTCVSLQLALLLEIVDIQDVRYFEDSVIIRVKACSHYDLLAPFGYYDIHTDTIVIEQPL